ncbi:MAG: putative transposase [Gammaproteobacteria bacterium]|jgi:putative transposase
MVRFTSAKSLQMFVSLHASIYNHFNLERHPYNRQQFKSNRTVALNEWRQLAR